MMPLLPSRTHIAGSFLQSPPIIWMWLTTTAAKQSQFCFLLSMHKRNPNALITIELSRYISKFKCIQFIRQSSLVAYQMSIANRLRCNFLLHHFISISFILWKEKTTITNVCPLSHRVCRLAQNSPRNSFKFCKLFLKFFFKWHYADGTIVLYAGKSRTIHTQHNESVESAMIQN